MKRSPGSSVQKNDKRPSPITPTWTFITRDGGEHSKNIKSESRRKSHNLCTGNKNGVGLLESKGRCWTECSNEKRDKPRKSHEIQQRARLTLGGGPEHPRRGRGETPAQPCSPSAGPRGTSGGLQGTALINDSTRCVN